MAIIRDPKSPSLVQANLLFQDLLTKIQVSKDNTCSNGSHKLSSQASSAVF
jgi:hypothetical protein